MTCVSRRERAREDAHCSHNVAGRHCSTASDVTCKIDGRGDARMKGRLG